MNIDDIDDETLKADLLRAWNWYGKHRAHVERLVANEKTAIEPSGGDRFQPQLWEAIHWKWFFDISDASRAIPVRK